MGLNALEIENVLAEVIPLLEGGWIQKIHQPTDRTLRFDIRLPNGTRRLVVSCEPGATRLHLSLLTLPNPPRPPSFCQFLRAHFQGARVDRIHQRPNDRIVTLSLTTKRGQHSVVCELTGKTANVLVLDEQQCVLRDLTSQSKIIGQTYQPPLCENTGEKAGITSRFTPVNGKGDCPVSTAIEAHYRARVANLAEAQARDVRLQGLKKALKKEQRRIQAWREDLARADKYRGYDRYGELIKANLGSIKKGMDGIELIDYYDEAMPNISVPLDITKSPQGNMDEYFRKYRKYLSARRELNPRLAQAEHGIEKLRREIRAIEEGLWVPPKPMSADTRATAPRILRTSQGKDKERRRPFRRFLSTDGLPIFVGRNAKENDELTFGLAKSDDLWLHARGTPGSHVVVRLEKGSDLPIETLKDAATLALLYSDLKKSGKGEVIYAKRKWVKKAKGQAPGAVLVTQEKVIYAAVDRSRLDALKVRSLRNR